MATTPNKPAAGKPVQKGFVYLPLIAGWLVPGAGHFLLGKWIRGTLLAVSIIAMFALGLAMQGNSTRARRTSSICSAWLATLETASSTS